MKNESQNIDRVKIWKLFKANFKYLYGKEFIENPITISNISLLFYYFLREEEKFLNHTNLLKANLPSLNKGLLILGGYGVGKTDYMRALEMTLTSIPKLRFRLFNANEIVVEFEKCKTPHDKEAFFDKYNNGIRCFDDVKTERNANNFGKVNVFKDLLENRYHNKARTYLTCNYKVGYEGDPVAALNEFGEKYGGRVHDRVFEMFNIVVFTGKSMRL